MEPDPSPLDDFRKRLLNRDSERFDRLPLEYKWEFTRRHPYYLLNWHLTKAESAGVPKCQTNDVIRLLYMGALGLSHMASNAPDPALDFDKLDEYGDTWIDTHGIQPVTVRKLTRWLLAKLPPEDANVVAGLLREAVSEERTIPEDDKYRLVQRFSAIYKLDRHSSPTLDSLFDECVLTANAYLSDRTLQKGLKREISRYREQHDISSTDLRVNSIKGYLKAWDSIEGWRDGRYDLAAMCTFKAAAKSQKTAVSSLWSQYRSAFKWITGHEYQLESWWLVCGRYFTCLGQVECDEFPAKIFAKRRANPGSSSPVDETTIFSKSDSPDHGLSGTQAVPENEEVRDLLIDIKQMQESRCPRSEMSRKLAIAPILVDKILDMIGAT